MSRPTVVTAVLAALAAPAPAVAEDPEPPEAVPTKLAVRLDGDRAALQLTVRLALRGPEVHALSVDVPFHGSLVGATVRERGRTRALDLVEATRAGERFAAIQAGPAGAGRAAAILLSDEDLGRIEVAAAVPRRTTLALELDYTAPTCFLRDHRHVRIPAAWAAVLDAAARRRVVPAEAAAEPDGVAERCAPTSWGHDDRGAVWLALPTDELAARPPGDDRIGVRAERFAAGLAELARVELAVATTMSAVPADLATVFVVDGSRSLTADQRTAQRAVIDSYLRHAPGSRVQVIAFDRVARPLLPRWTAATRRDIGRALDRLAPGNGSDLDRGLAAAGAALAEIAGTRRVVVFTDELVPARVAALDPARLADVLPAGTVVHVVALAAGRPGTLSGVFRDDAGLFAPLAIATTGLAARAADRFELGIDALELVRPTAIDHLRVIAPGFEPRDTAGLLGAACEPQPDDGAAVALREGQACTWWAKGPATADAVTLEGRIWNRVWRRLVPLGEPASPALARDGWAVLDDERDPTLRAALDVAARAVNRRWSLLATWGGAGGYDDLAPGSGSASACSCGDPAGHMSGDAMTGGPRIRTRPVRDQVAAVIAACRADAGGAAIRLELDTTRHEIIAVAAVEAPAALAACAEAAVWALDLIVPEERDPAPEHAHWSLAFARATAASDPASSRRAPVDPAPAPATP